MENSGDPNPESTDPLTPANPMDTFTAALHEMEERLTKNMKSMINNKEDKITKNMKEMIEPIKADTPSLEKCQKEWEQHKTDVCELQLERNRLNHKIKEVEEETQN